MLPVQYEGVASAEEEENYYSVPPNSVGQLYDYLAEKKCIEIPSNAVRSVPCVCVCVCVCVFVRQVLMY